MHRNKRWLGILVSCAALLLMVAAAPVDAPRMARTVFGGGGGAITDGVKFHLRSTIAEPIAGELSIKGDRGIASGYWQKLPGDYEIYLPTMR